MVDNDIELNRLCQVFENLDDDDKEKVIKLAESLLNSQRIICDESINYSGKTEINKLKPNN